jgi:hypothetical protein
VTAIIAYYLVCYWLNSNYFTGPFKTLGRILDWGVGSDKAFTYTMPYYTLRLGQTISAWDANPPYVSAIQH